MCGVPPFFQAVGLDGETVEKWTAGPAVPPSGPREGRREGREGRRTEACFQPRFRLRPENFSGLFVGPGCRRGPVTELESEVAEIGEKRVRVNEQIRISPVRLITDDGEQLGIVSIDDARLQANERGLDLVEVAPDARPPVVKMMDYGKYKYEAARQAREARKKQHTIQVKEGKFRPGI